MTMIIVNRFYKADKEILTWVEAGVDLYKIYKWARLLKSLPQHIQGHGPPPHKMTEKSRGVTATQAAQPCSRIVSQSIRGVNDESRVGYLAANELRWVDLEATMCHESETNYERDHATINGATAMIDRGMFAS
eukprot:scaffold99803_cov127-Cyclotella_meneghiniana.AAC.2